jgi:hypothetical protein
MILQNQEFYETDMFQYLLIHKNASSTVKELIKEKYNFKIVNQRTDKLCWTIIRDPFERLVSGLSYDLNINLFDINKINLDDLLLGKINEQSRKDGFISHCFLQSTYLFNTNVNWYVDMKNLDSFFEMHFNKNIKYNSYDQNKKKIKLFLNKRKNEIHSLLKVDFFIYNQIKNSSHYWNWFNGKIF